MVASNVTVRLIEATTGPCRDTDMSMSLESQCLWRVLIEAEATTHTRDTDTSMSL